MAEFMKPYSAKAYALMRIIVGALFLCHGLSKLFGIPIAPPPGAQRLSSTAPARSSW
jgi:putative oxidoreductase